MLDWVKINMTGKGRRWLTPQTSRKPTYSLFYLSWPRCLEAPRCWLVDGRCSLAISQWTSTIDQSATSHLRPSWPALKKTDYSTIIYPVSVDPYSIQVRHPRVCKDEAHWLLGKLVIPGPMSFVLTYSVRSYLDTLGVHANWIDYSSTLTGSVFVFFSGLFFFF